MSHSVDDKRRVFLAYRRLFSDDNAHIRNTKRIKALVTKYEDWVPQLLKELKIKKTVEILKELLENHIFESDTYAKATFPEVFQVSYVRNVQRAASETEAARSEVEALNKLAPGGKLHAKGKNEDQKTLPKQGPIKLAPEQEPIKPAPEQDSIKLEELPKPMVDELPKPPEPKVPSLYPISISYKVEYLILATTQRLLEECCFDFAVKWTPDLLERKGWDCSEAAELTLWTRTLSHICDTLPADAICNKPKISLDTVFASTEPLRNSAVHRPPTSAKGIQEMIQSAIRLAVTLGDTTRSKSLELVKSSIDARIKDMELNKNFLENRLDEQLQLIREKRAELDREEAEAVATMIKEDLANKQIVSSNLEASVREAFGLDGAGGKIERGSGILVSNKNDKNAIEHTRESSEGEDSD